MPINVLSSKQSQATNITADKVIKLLNDCNTHPETKIFYHASLSEKEAKSRAGGFFYMGSGVKTDKKLTTGAILIISKVLEHVMSSATKAEIGAVMSFI
jgi:hypothetical protein